MHFGGRGGRLAALGVVVALSGCGGGGGGSGAAPAPSYPSSGQYAFVLKPNGPTQSMSFGLSLVHPASASDEYEIEAVSSGITDTMTVKSGTVDTAQGRVTGVAAHALLYIVGGDIKWLPLAADGTAPASRVKRAGITTACKFGGQLNDYTNPDNSYFTLTTKGTDGICGTADDGVMEIQAGPAGVTTTGDSALAYVRDPATLGLAGRVQHDGVAYVSPTPTLLVFAVNGNLAQSVVAVAGSQLLIEWGTTTTRQLDVVDRRGASYTALLDATLTAGAGWTLIGYDATNFYVYRNGSGAWKVLKIARVNPVATLLASGTGTIGSTAMGIDVLYVNVSGAAGSIGGNGNQLLRLSKTTAGAPSILDSTGATSLTSVLTSANGVHEWWRVTNVGLPSQAFTVEMRDEAGTLLYTGAGGFIMGSMSASAQDFNNSVSDTRFIFATGFGASSFADTALVLYDTATRTARTLGTLPGTAQFPGNAVEAWAFGGSDDFVVGSGAPLVAGVVQGASTKVFSAQAATAGSLAYTTTKR